MKTTKITIIIYNKLRKKNATFMDILCVDQNVHKLTVYSLDPSDWMKT